MAILTTVLLFQHKRFDSSTLLRALAYSAALSMRQAQLYGTSVRQFNNSFDYSYGVYFSSNPANDLSCTNGASTCYVLFADINGDHLYTVAEKVQQFNLGKGYSIVKFCGTIAGGGPHCSTDGSPITSLTIYFRRPNPDAQFLSSASAETYSRAYVQLVGPTGGTDTRGVTITSTGQISVGELGS